MSGVCVSGVLCVGVAVTCPHGALTVRVLLLCVSDQTEEAGRGPQVSSAAAGSTDQ